MRTEKLAQHVRIFLCAVLLAGCSATSDVRLTVSSESSPPARDVIAEIRAVALGEQDGIDILPLGDPVIADLRDQAARHEVSGEWEKARNVLDLALALEPGNPEILQWQAELALAQGLLDEAVELANASWERGPRLGSLCRRNWAAIRLARELTDYPEAAQVANTQLSRCTVEPPVRM